MITPFSFQYIALPARAILFTSPTQELSSSLLQLKSYPLRFSNSRAILFASPTQELSSSLLQLKPQPLSLASESVHATSIDNDCAHLSFVKRHTDTLKVLAPSPPPTTAHPPTCCPIRNLISTHYSAPSVLPLASAYVLRALLSSILHSTSPCAFPSAPTARDLSTYHPPPPSHTHPPFPTTPNPPPHS